MFVGAGAEGEPFIAVIAGGFGFAGLFSWDRGNRKQQMQLPAERRDDTVEMRLRPLEQRLFSMQEDLLVTQRQLVQMSEERDFLRKLYPTGQRIDQDH